MKTTQTGCIQTILERNGRFSHYRCTLPIPLEVAHLYPNMIESKKNRHYYVKSDVNFDRLWYNINLVQVTVNDWKVTKYEEKKNIALSRCGEYMSLEPQDEREPEARYPE